MKEKLDQIIHTLIQDHQNDSIQLMGENGLGTACLLGYHALYKQEDVYQDFLYKILVNIQETLSADEPTYTHTFCNGLAGLGWFLQHLTKKEILDVDLSELLLDLDEAVFNFAIQSFENNNTDFLHGPVGHACYLINRVEDNTQVKDYLIAILDKLEETSISNEKGMYWYDHVLTEEEEDQQIINFGLSHGLASKIVLFAKLIQAGIDVSRAKKMLESSCHFMLNHQNTKDHLSILPDRLPENSPAINFPLTRLAWCYGDLGCSIALWQAGVALHDEHIKQEAIAICLHTTQRQNTQENRALDAGLCHGAAGISHIYKRMYGYTQVSKFQEASAFWLKKTLEMSHYEDGLAGFKTLIDQPNQFENDNSFLTGISGIGLALLAQLYPDEASDWDECLLLS